jgi:hypothetical protein
MGNFQPLYIFIIIIIIAYLYDIFGVGLNKSYYFIDNKDLNIFSLITVILVGLLIFLTCSIGYTILPWVLTTITIIDLIIVFILNALNIYIDNTAYVITPTKTDITNEKL